MVNLEILYDFGNEFPRLYPTIIPFICFLVSLGGTYFSYNSARNSKKDLMEKLTDKTLPGCLLFTFLTGFMSYAVLNLDDYFATKRIYNSGTMKQTTGYITNLKKIHYDKYESMSFIVNGLSFSFSDNDVSHYGCVYSDLKGFNIRDSSRMKIYYINEPGTNIALMVDRESSSSE